MKLKTSLMLAALNIALFSSTAQADIRISTPFMMGDLCSQISGHWTGSGNISIKPFISCDYAGDGDMSVPSAGRLSFDVNFHKTGGSKQCPQAQHVVLEGTCKGQTVLIYSKNVADLSGELSADGKAVNNVKGTIYVTDAHLPADALLNLKKG